MICLGKPGGDNEDGLLKLLETLLSREMPPEEKKRILRDEFDIPMTQTLEKEVSLMCNLSDGVWEEAMTQGIEKGLVTALRNLMDSMGWPMEQAMNALRIPEADRQEYAAQIAKQ